MKALVYTGVEQLEYRDVPDPVLPEGYELIKIESAGICGSDMHAYHGHDARRPAPLILGHEAAGTVVEGSMKGTRITINPLVTCGTCERCVKGEDNLCGSRQIISMPPREGSFAQFVAMPSGNLVTMPDHVSTDQAALAEPIACGWHTVRLCRERLGANVDRAKALVFGGGAIGVGAALSAMAQGVRDVTIVEPNEKRRAFIAAHSIAPVAAGTDNLEPIYDMIIDGVGYPATRAAASALARPGGVIGHIGLGSSEGGLDIRRMTLQEITFIGTYTYTAEDFRQTAQAIFDGRLGALDWTETRPLENGAQAFADIDAGTAQSPKIILKPNHEKGES